MRIHYYLEIGEEGKIHCRKCGLAICSNSENYKDHVPRAQRWPDELPGQHPRREVALTVYYEYYCPGCYTLLDVEIAEKGAPPLWDIQIAR